MVGLCPFHDERVTESFRLDATRQVYYCARCGAVGDVFQFVMATERVMYEEAVLRLAERYRVPVDDEEDERVVARRERAERLFALLDRTATYYSRLLWESPDAASARKYLADRGITEQTLHTFRVGYAPTRPGGNSVVARAVRAGTDPDDLIAVGLAKPGRGQIQDFFWGRILFPLADLQGRVVGFGGRAMTNAQKPKYLNTPEGELFHKGRIIYGADLAREHAALTGRVVLVEGYTDVLALHQAGVPETVAQMGTAITDDQIRALAALAPLVMFCQDPDTAGQESLSRGLAMLHHHNVRHGEHPVRVQVVRLPPGRDPALVVQQDGPEAMRRLLDRQGLR